MNALDEYFSRTGDNPSALAQRIGRAASSITRPLRGERNASMDLALDVERGTSGAVSAEIFLSICLAAKRPSAPDAPTITPSSLDCPAPSAPEPAGTGAFAGVPVAAPAPPPAGGAPCGAAGGPGCPAPQAG